MCKSKLLIDSRFAFWGVTGKSPLGVGSTYLKFLKFE